MDGAISLLRAGGVLTIDDALGSGTAAGLLLETKELLAAGVLRGDTPQSEAFSKIIYEHSPDGKTVRFVLAPKGLPAVGESLGIEVGGPRGAKS